MANLISSVDTYVYTQLKEKLKIILENPEILQHALKGIDDIARENFIKTYGGKDPIREVEVSYHYPGTKENLDARYVIQMGSGHETKRSLGNIESNYDFRESNESNEFSYIQDGEDYLYIELESPIGEVYALDNISFSESDNMRHEGNRILFEKQGNERLVGGEVQVHYLAKEHMIEGEDPTGFKKGYSSNDEVEISPLSTNMDTARCLDSILKVILILMADSGEEKSSYLLQQTTFGAMGNIILEEMDRLVFGRPVTIEYVVNYTIDYDILSYVKSVELRGTTRYE